jgi:hypothetical protein
VCGLELRDGTLVLTLKPGASDLVVGEQTRKRLAALAAVLGCPPRIEDQGA